MNKSMYELCEWVLGAAKRNGAADCKVAFSKTRFVEIEYRDRKPETIREATSQGLSLDVYVNGRFSAQSTSDLRKTALETFIADAAAAAKLLAEDKFRSLPDPKYYQGRAEVDLRILDPAYQEMTPERRHAISRAAEAACLEAGGNKVISATATMRDRRNETTVLTSNGFQGYSESTDFWISASMTAQDEGDRHPNGYDSAGARIFKDLVSPESIGRGAAKRTLDLLGAKKIKTETLPIIIENRSVGRVLGGFIGALTGRSLQQKQSFLADKKGQRIGGETFALVDDPLLPGGLSSALFDGDGFAARKRTIVEAGVLREYFVDWYYSRKLGWEPTTGGPANLIIPPGRRSVDQIMKDLGRGVLLTGFIGGNSNSTTGDFSVGVFGHLFDGGVPVQPIAEMNIADNHLKFWTKLVEAGNDPFPYSSLRTPSLVFKDVVVSGI
jgi:PmbA protein